MGAISTNCPRHPPMTKVSVVRAVARAGAATVAGEAKAAVSVAADCGRKAVFRAAGARARPVRRRQTARNPRPQSEYPSGPPCHARLGPAVTGVTKGSAMAMMLASAAARPDGTTVALPVTSLIGDRATVATGTMAPPSWAWETTCPASS
jgi:hypothetical protein